VAKDIEEVASLLKDFRNPSRELLHFVYLNDDGVVLAHTAITSNEVDLVQLSKKEFNFKLQDRAKKLGATQIYSAHNHPSGDVEPSFADEKVLLKMATNNKNVKGGIILDHNRATFMNIKRDGPMVYLDTEESKFIDFGDLYEQLKQEIDSQSKFLEVVKKQHAFDPGRIGIFTVGATNRLMDYKSIKLNPEKINETIQQFIKASNSKNAFVAVNEVDFSKLGPLNNVQDIAIGSDKDIRLLSTNERNDYLVKDQRQNYPTMRVFEKEGEYELSEEPQDTEDIEAIYQEELQMDKEQMEKALEEYMAESFPKPIKAFSKAPMESFVAKLTPEKFSLLTPTQQSIVAKFDKENRFAEQMTKEEIKREIGADLSPTAEYIAELLATKSEKAGEKIKDGKVVPIRKVIRKKIRLGERASEFRELLGDDLYYKINTEDRNAQTLEEIVERINEKQVDQIDLDDFLEAMYRTIKGKDLLTKAQRDVRQDFQEARQEQSRKRYNLTQLAKKIEKERTRKEELVFKIKGEGKAKLEKVITEEREKRSRAVGRIMQQNEIIKTNLNNLVKIRQIRAEKIDIVQEFFGLSDREMAKVRGQKNIQMMSDAEFNFFLTEVSNKAQLEAERIDALVQLKGTIYGLELQNVDNLRKVMSYPVIEKMSIKQLKDFDALLSEYEFRDEFLSERKLETIDKTDFKGVKTIREAREKVAEKVGVRPEDLKIDVSEFDRFRFDTALAEKDPFYKYFVEGFSASILEGDAVFAEEQHKIDELFGKARKGKGIVGALIPQDQKVMAYLESENKEEAAKTMTPDEIKAAEYVRLKLGEAYAYELETQMLKKSSYEDIYVPHIQRTFLEAIKDSGFKVAMKEMLDQHKIDEKIMTILDQKTGDILPMEKFFRFAMRRTGEVIPTQNVAKAFLAYMRAFERKRALDRIIPEIMTAVDVVSPREMTEKGLAMDDTLKTFVKEYLNTKKGRPVKMFIKPGGKIDWVLRSVKGFTYLTDLAINIPVQIGSVGGVQVPLYVLLGAKNYAKGWKRLLSKQGQAITKKYENYTDRTPWNALKDASVGLGDKAYSLMFALFKDATVRGNKIQLLGSLTDQEFATGEVTAKRLAELKTELGRWSPVEGSESILGSTTEGGIENQYKKPERGEFGPLSNRTLTRTVEYLMRILSYQTLSSKDLVFF
jgi:hypothetical protein